MLWKRRTMSLSRKQRYHTTVIEEAAHQESLLAPRLSFRKSVVVSSFPLRFDLSLPNQGGTNTNDGLRYSLECYNTMTCHKTKVSL